jgi:subtilisin family serine protease
MTSHEDLQGILVTGSAGNLPWDQDGNGHGSHVAGTIAAMNNNVGVVGVTPGTVQLHIVRIFGNDGLSAYSSDLIHAAITCAMEAGVNIINMSLGGNLPSTAEQLVFDQLNALGILSIAAAGNTGDSTMEYPAAYPSVMSVASIDANKVVASDSTRNFQVDISAPGVGVLSTVPYISVCSLTVDAVTYTAGIMSQGSASGALVSGGLCDIVPADGSWSGKVVICKRGSILFSTKVNNVGQSGGVAAVIYNNVPGSFGGIIKEQNITIPAVSLSMEDGEYVVTNNLDLNGNVVSNVIKNASGYYLKDGTSMAAPHVSAVAALVW